MPPKKQAAAGKGAAVGAVDEDLSDVAQLPQLNEFIYCNFYAFKYRKNQQRVEQQLYKELYKAPEGETAEAAKRNKIIQQSDLLNQAKAKAYLTEDEVENIAHVDPVKVRQVLARTTNEILASITVPLRRIKADEQEKFKEKVDKITEDYQKAEALKEHKAAQSAVELSVWLKDFPRSADDFKELRRSGAQHMPEIEVAIQGLFLIEEQFKHDEDEEEDVIGGRRDSTVDNTTMDEAELKKAESQYLKEDRVTAFHDTAYVSKFARNCPVYSSMRYLTVQKFKFVGPDPPLEPIKKDDDEAQEEVKAPPPKGKQVEVPVEIELTPEEKAELQMFEGFATHYSMEVDKVKDDLSAYRALNHPEHGVQKIALWPKTYSSKEIKAMREAEEKRIQEQEEAEAERRRIEEEKAAANAPKGKAATKKAAEQPARTASRAGVSSAGSQLRESRDQTLIDELLKKNRLCSVDDERKEFGFKAFERAMSQMDCASTSTGGILAAMVYQIEEDNVSAKKDEQPQIMEKQSALGDEASSIRGISDLNVLASVDMLTELGLDNKDQLAAQLDDLYNALVIEQGVLQTDYSHQFRDNKVASRMHSSPYQAVYNDADTIGVNDGKFTFLDGQTVSSYETRTLNKMDLPGINDRFKMPEKATRTRPERDSDTQAILKLYPNVTHQGKRLIVLKAFEELLKNENQEREYDFLRRNFTEEMDAGTFRQTLVEAMRLCPDVNTHYFDKEDALLLALNFKNPPGRLLRRQWTYPLKTMPDIATWRQFVKEGQCEIVEPVIDIPTHKAGFLRSNQKFCFPCDNSIIRVDKHIVSGRRFGASVIIKDNLVFGIKEDPVVAAEKVAGDDELPNLETRKASNRNCEFWLEFENKARLHIAMLEPVGPEKELIPPQSNGGASRNKPRHAELGSVESMSPMKPDTAQEGGSPSRKGNESALEQNAAPVEGQMGTIDSTLRESKDRAEILTQGEAKTVTIDASQPETFDKGEIQTQQDPMMVSKSQFQFDPNYEADKGASLTFTYKEGLVVQILPNGNVQQNLIRNSPLVRKNSVLSNDMQEETMEVYRIVTRQAQVIRQLKDGNQVIYYPDGTITTTDHRRGIWRTTNHLGVVRERNVRTGLIKDQMVRLAIHEKIDPETNAKVLIREDGMLKIIYPDRRTLLVMPDHSEILITKSGPLEEGSAVTTTFFKKEGYAPVKITSDPVKARSGTIIGLGGTDALMGKDSIMERSFGGLISETYLPDRSVVQTYLEKQELPGYNKFSTSLIHLLKRDDSSMMKVRQDGEVVVITASERKYLNSIGKEMEYGVDDYDYFFELFGVPSERRSGVYTANLDLGRIWTEDEEGNHFIVYANGDSTEKLSVSFNLDQMVEGIDNKEPSSPRIADGEYIEDECKFLPPPKTVAHPRLFLVREKGAIEFLNEELLEYLIMCNKKSEEVLVSSKRVAVDNEQATSHLYLRKQRAFNAHQPSHLPAESMARLPQALEMVNQTVSIATEPESCTFLQRNILEFPVPSDSDVEKFNAAIVAKEDMRAQQAKQREDLKIEKPHVSEEALTTHCRIMLRMARQRGIDVQKLIGDEYRRVKVDDRDENRRAVMKTLDDHFKADAN